jgi:hypothetical protein
VVNNFLKVRILFLTERITNISKLLEGKIPANQELKWRHQLPQIKLQRQVLETLVLISDAESLRRKIVSRLETLQHQITAHKALLVQSSSTNAGIPQWVALLEEFEVEQGFLQEALEGLVPASTSG